MGPTTTGRQRGLWGARDCWSGVLVYTERVGGSSPSGCTWLGVADLLVFCGSWRFSWGWWCLSVLPPFWVVCGGVGWGDDNGTTTEGGNNEAAPPPGEVAGRCAAAVTGLAAAGAGRTEGMAGGAEAHSSGCGTAAGDACGRRRTPPSQRDAGTGALCCGRQPVMGGRAYPITLVLGMMRTAAGSSPVPSLFCVNASKLSPRSATTRPQFP